MRFTRLPEALEGCVLQSATLRLYDAAPGEGRVLEAHRLASAWSESAVTSANQPATAGSASSVGSGDEAGYREWKVTGQVGDGVEHGFLIRDSIENDTGEQAFHARDKGENPPQVVLRFAPPPDPVQAPRQPVPAVLACGDEVTLSTLLMNDLTNCLGDGLRVTEPLVVLDLNGHTVDGIGLAVGVRVDGVDDVVVRNGTIADFDHGVQLAPGTTRGVVEFLTLTANQVSGIDLRDADGPAGGNTVRQNTLSGNGLGIALLDGTSNAAVHANTVLENAGEGLVLHGSDRNLVEGNQFTGGSDRAVELLASSDNVLRANSITGSGDGGIDVVLGSHRNTLEDNRLSETGDSGILVSESDGNVLEDNSAHGMSDNGIVLSTVSGTTVRGNDVRFNPTGLELSGAVGNLIEGNDASESSGNGMELGGGSYANRVRLNVASRGGGTGIVVADDALLADVLEPGTPHANVVERNTADGNLGNGIEASKGGHVLLSNTTIGNRGWGIYAQPGTIADVTNVATGNGEGGQCFGILCVAGEDLEPPETVIDTASRHDRGHRRDFRVRRHGRRHDGRRAHLPVPGRRQRVLRVHESLRAARGWPPERTRSRCARSTGPARSIPRRRFTCGQSSSRSPTSPRPTPRSPPAPRPAPSSPRRRSRSPAATTGLPWVR